MLKEGTNLARRQWTGRRIKRNHSSTLPRYIISLDTETLPTTDAKYHNVKNHSLRLGVAKFARLAEGKLVGIKSIRFKTSREIWDWIYARTAVNYTTWLVAHNALFDLVVSGFATEIEQARMSLSKPRAKRHDTSSTDERSSGRSICVIDSPPTIIGLQVASSGGRLIVVDTLNWFKCPLEELGRVCNLPKKAMPAWEATDDAWFDYCERDCDIVLATFANLMQWASEQDVGVFKYTAAGQSMAAFRHRFMEREIFVHDNEPVTKIERQAYYGGRTEVFKLGDINETVWQVDINSLFPWTMATGAVPYRLVRYETDGQWTTDRPVIQFSRSIAEVQIVGGDGNIPVRHSGFVQYPVGGFVTTLAGPELQIAAEKGLITAFRNWATYDCDILFESFVKHFYSLRQHYKATHQPLYDTFAKGILNSLYGKFAQLAPRWLDQPDRYDAEPWSTWVELDGDTRQPCEYRSFGYAVQKRVADEPHPNSFTAISAFITAYARVRMNQLRAIAGKHNCYYQGVDGLIVNRTGYENLCNAGEIDDTKIGKLRHILQANYGYISGIGDYQVGSKVAIGGLSRGYQANWDGSYLSRSFVARDNLFTENKKDVVSEIERNWVRSNKYHRGNPLNTGWIDPIHLNDYSGREGCSPEPTDAACPASDSTAIKKPATLFS